MPVERLYSPLSTMWTFSWRFFKTSIKRHSSLSFIPFCFNLYISPSCHTLSKALDMSRNTPLTSKPLSKEVKISWVIDRSWFMQESSGLNLDYFGVITLLRKKYFNMLSYIIRSKILEEERMGDSFWCFVCRLFKKLVQCFLFSSHLKIFHILSNFWIFWKEVLL